MKYMFIVATLMILLSSALNAQTLSAVKFLDATNVVASGTGGTILRSGNGGATWTTVSSGTTNYLFGIAYPTSTNGTIVGGNPVNGGQNILYSANSGGSYSPQSSTSTQPLLGVSFSDVNNGWAVGYSGTALKTTNGGATWVSVYTGVLSAMEDVC